MRRKISLVDIITWDVEEMHVEDEQTCYGACTICEEYGILYMNEETYRDEYCAECVSDK